MISKTQIGDIRNRVQVALDLVGKDLGMDLKMGAISYDSDGFRCKLKGRWEDSLPEVCVDYDNHQIFSGLPMRGSVIEFQGDPYQVYGYKKRATKRPIIIADMGGSQYVISERACENSKIIQEAEEAN